MLWLLIGDDRGGKKFKIFIFNHLKFFSFWSQIVAFHLFHYLWCHFSLIQIIFVTTIWTWTLLQKWKKKKKKDDCNCLVPPPSTKIGVSCKWDESNICFFVQPYKYLHVSNLIHKNSWQFTSVSCIISCFSSPIITWMNLCSPFWVGPLRFLCYRFIKKCE